MSFLNKVTEEHYLINDYDWPTIFWIEDGNSGFIRFSAPEGHTVYNLKNSVIEFEDGAFYVKDRKYGLQE